MYLDCKVKIPDDRSGITQKTIKNTVYIYYNYDRTYDADKKYSKPKDTSIGKLVDGEPGMMHPNPNFFKFFPEVEIPDADESGCEPKRSGCLRIGTFLVLRHIIAEYHLDEILGDIIGKGSGLFLDIAAYTIIAENNAGQYYPDYAYNHPLLTAGMKVYSDTKVSEFIGGISRDQSIEFQNEWNDARDHREKIYISYDSTNKNCQAGDIDMVEYGHPKDDEGAPVFNYSMAYDCSNSVPLFYEDYPGSIVDVSQLQMMVEKAKGYGYRHVGFILDRGYFSKENIRYMDKCGYEFVIMMKGMKSLVSELVLEVKGTFEEKRECSIREYRVSGTTVKRRLYPSDENDRYFHVYYSDRKKSSKREAVEKKIDRMSQWLESQEGKERSITGFDKYFDIIYYHEGQDDQTFISARELTDVINREIQLCGYFVIITSEKMTAAEALDLYKSRDASEKLFRGDKSYLGNKSLRVQSEESLQARIFIEYVALIIRNRFHRCLKEQVKSEGKKENFMTVPAAIRELEKIELIRQSDGNYRLDHAVTAVQKEILKAFGMTAQNVKIQAVEINKSLQAANTGEAE